MPANESLTKPSVQRLFFALWPSAEIRQQLTAITQATVRYSDGRCTHENNLHITLRFLGSVSEDKLICIEDVASEITVKPFELVLDQLVFKKRQKMIWLATDRPIPEELNSIVNQIEQGMQSCGFTPEKYSYKPHTTLTHKTTKIKVLPEIVPVKWSVDAFVLVCSKTYQKNVEYLVLKEWKFVD